MKKHLIVFLLFIFGITSHCQDKTLSPFQNKNSFQLEILGSTVFYSLNYERILINGGRLKTAAQAGISYYPPSLGVRDFWLPIGINEIISFGNHHIEAGMGYMPVRESLRDPDLQVIEWFWSHMITGRIGYRYQKPDGHLILRAAFTPVLEVNIPGFGAEFHPLAGVSLGYSF